MVKFMQKNGKAPSFIGAWKDLSAQIRRELGLPSFCVGVDIGSSAIKIAVMGLANGSWAMVRSVLVDIGGDRGDEEVLASLKTALIGVPMAGSRIAVVVNCPQTSTRKISTPHMPAKELPQAVQWEVRHAIPFAMEEAVIDFEVLGESSDKGISKLTVAVVATARTTVERIMKISSQAGFQIAALVPVSMALQNLITRFADADKTTVAVIEMGAVMTELNIYNQGRLAFSRRLPVSGNDITRALTSPLMSSQGKVELTWEEAERIKKEYGVPRGDEPAEPVEGKILPIQVLSLVRPCLEQLAGEIERSFDFYREESHGGRVSKLILFGGAANLKGLGGFLHAECGIPVEVGDVFHGEGAGEPPDGKRQGERFDLAVGAALHRRGKINLLPLENRQKTDRLARGLVIKAAATAFLVLVTLFVLGIQLRLAGYRKELRALQLERQVLSPKLESLRAAVSVGEILKAKPYWEDVFKEISQVIPAKVYLTRMDMDKDTLHLAGESLGGGRDPQEGLSRLMLALEDGIFRNVTLVTAQKKGDNSNNVQFEITCSLE